MRQTVLITGAATRVGKALACMFAAKGWNVVMHCNQSFDDAVTTRSALEKKYPGGIYSVVRADLRFPVEAARLIFESLPKGIDHVDLLINNASVFTPGQLMETSLELFREQMVVNLEAPFFVMQRYHQLFKGGAIINVLDSKIKSNTTSHAAYLLSKKALMHITLMAALEWAPGTRVNAVAPGPVLPPAGMDSDYLERVALETPLKATVSLQNLFDCIYSIASNSSVTGQVFYCDSGSHLKS